MKKMIMSLVAASLMVLTACGGAGSTNITGTKTFTHAELAEIFVERLNDDLGFDVDLVKTNTLQFGYIVVFDNDFQSFDAYYVDGNDPDVSPYVVGERIDIFVDVTDAFDLNKLDLIEEANNRYFDPVSGLTFRKASGSMMDLASSAAVVEQVVVDSLAARFSLKYSIPDDRAAELAGGFITARNTGDVDAFTEMAFGFSIEEAQATVAADQKAGAEELINRAIELNGAQDPAGLRNLVKQSLGL